MTSRATFDAPMISPVGLRTGEIVTDTSIGVPSLRRRTVSKWSTRSPRRSRSRIFGSSSRRSGGKITSIGLPIISAAVYPKIRSAAGFQLRTMPLRSLLTIASSEDSMIAWK